MNVIERLSKAREIMQKNGIEAFYITSSDYHQSEYIGDYFKLREFLSGFTGSFGYMVLTLKSAAVWTDGRYEVQVGEQLDGTGIIPFVIGKAGAPEFKEWIASQLKEGEVIGFDGRTVSAKTGLELKNYFKSKNININENIQIADEIWENRPELACTPAFILPVSSAGKSYDVKIELVREKIKAAGADKNILITLDDIAWLYNLRGRDIKCTPVTLAYSVISQEESILYIEKSKIEGKVLSYLNENNVTIKPYEMVYEDTKKFKENEKILIDSNKLNFSIYNAIEKYEIIDTQLPTTLLKAVKNSIEIENTKHAHLKDAVAVTKFMFWIKKNITNMELNEISAGKKVESFREEQENYIEPSFNTISAYMANAAMPHYSATEEKFANLKAEGLYLLDSGGQYLEGTTDITRTFALGVLPEGLKRDFTLVLKGMISLSEVKFLAGTTGSALDILARKSLWQEGLNFNHGTGHGIGHVLGVHEGPIGIRQAHSPFPLEPGMILTNEPGLYIPGSHGIRIENELLVTEFKESVFGKFYQFEPLTFVPIDLDAIDVTLLNNEEKNYLNGYHREVFEKVSPFLNEEEREWLKEYTKAI